MTKKRNNLFLFMLLCLFINVSFALNTDESEPLQIQANQADFDKQKGISTYHGNVVLLQGTTHVTGNFGVAYFDTNNQIKQATVTGKPAHYWTIPEANKPELHVFGEKIDLYPEKHIAIATGNARVEQNKDHLSGDRIVYNLTTHEVHAFSNNKNRTSILLTQKK